jgi:hypothetical protein
MVKCGSSLRKKVLDRGKAKYLSLWKAKSQGWARWYTPVIPTCERLR